MTADTRTDLRLISAISSARFDPVRQEKLHAIREKWGAGEISTRTVAAILNVLETLDQATTPQATTGEPEIVRMARSFEGKTLVDRVAIAMMLEWGRRDTSSIVSQHPISYVANFADMARVAIGRLRDEGLVRD